MNDAIQQRRPMRAGGAVAVSVSLLVWVFGILSAASLVGCHSAPSMKPFSEATSQLAVGVKASGRCVRDEIALVTAHWPQDQKEAAAKVSGDFSKHWVARDGLAGALTEYSASLVAIVEAGDQGAASAQAVADSFSRLCGSVGAVLPPALAGDVAAKAAAKVYEMFSKDRAARTLAANMQNMQDELDKVVGVLQKDLEAIEAALVDLRAEAGPSLDDYEVDGMVPRVERNFLLQRTIAQRKIREESEALTVQLASSSTSSSDRPSEAVLAMERKLAGLRGELASTESSMALAIQRLAPINARIAEAESRIDAQIRVVRATREGLAAWAACHAELAAAAAEQKAPNVDDLVSVALELRELVKEARTSSK